MLFLNDCFLSTKLLCPCCLEYKQAIWWLFSLMARWSQRKPLRSGVLPAMSRFPKSATSSLLLTRTPVWSNSASFPPAPGFLKDVSENRIVWLVIVPSWGDLHRVMGYSVLGRIHNDHRDRLLSEWAAAEHTSALLAPRSNPPSRCFRPSVSFHTSSRAAAPSSKPTAMIFGEWKKLKWNSKHRSPHVLHFFRLAVRLLGFINFIDLHSTMN